MEVYSFTFSDNWLKEYIPQCELLEEYGEEGAFFIEPREIKAIETIQRFFRKNKSKKSLNDIDE